MIDALGIGFKWESSQSLAVMTEEFTGYDTQMIPISLATPVYDREMVERALNLKQTNKQTNTMLPDTTDFKIKRMV